LFRRLRLRHKTSVWASSGGPAGGKRLAEEEQLGRFTAKHSKYNWLYLYSGKVTLVETCLQ
jgi:hypothetical protein